MATEMKEKSKVAKGFQPLGMRIRDLHRGDGAHGRWNLCA